MHLAITINMLGKVIGPFLQWFYWIPNICSWAQKLMHGIYSCNATRRSIRFFQRFYIVENLPFYEGLTDFLHNEQQVFFHEKVWMMEGVVYGNAMFL